MLRTLVQESVQAWLASFVTMNLLGSANVCVCVCVFYFSHSRMDNLQIYEEVGNRWFLNILNFRMQ